MADRRAHTGLSGPSSPRYSWRSGILRRAGWGWLCNTRSAPPGCRTSGSPLIWRIVPPGSGWWQNGGTCPVPFGGNARQAMWILIGSKKKAIEQSRTNVNGLTCRTGCTRWLYRWGGWESSPELYLSGDLLCPCREHDRTNRLTGKLDLKFYETSVSKSYLLHASVRENKNPLMIHDSCYSHRSGQIRRSFIRQTSHLYLESSRFKQDKLSFEIKRTYLVTN